jgi:probable O-glycosylation ligase (exosortase A-associated)
MRSVFLATVFMIFAFYGFVAPFVAGLGYLWVDLVTPQRLAYSIINGQPISQIMAILTVALYLIADRKHAPKASTLHVLLFLWAIWVTLTTTWSAVPESAWIKWDWAFKSIAFAVFMPFLFRSRLQIEAFFLMVIFSVACFFLPAGAKTALGGGGYGTLGGLIESNRALAESSTLALVSVMLIPMMLHLRKHSLIFKPGRITDALFIGLSVIAVFAVVGTFARTGIVALAVLSLSTVMLLKRRVLYLTGIATATFLLLFLSPQDWQDRMMTTVNYENDASATGRLAVWKWTYDYVKEHPLGGGFELYQINVVTVETRLSDTAAQTNDQQRRIRQQTGKAFHSIYFEVLGEHGFPGLVLYLSILILTLRRLIAIRNGKMSHTLDPWQKSLATAMIMAISVFAAGGAFIGIAFQPFFYYFVAMAISLDQYILRSSKLSTERL